MLGGAAFLGPYVGGQHAWKYVGSSITGKPLTCIYEDSATGTVQCFLTLSSTEQRILLIWPSSPP
jgi:hypothetical protein